jgi:hypothetical protein
MIEHGIVIRHDQELVKDACGVEIQTPSGISTLECACGYWMHGATNYVRSQAWWHIKIAQEPWHFAEAAAVATATEDLPYQMVLDALAASREALTEAIQQHGRTVTRRLTVRSGSALFRVDRAYAALIAEAERIGSAP